MKVIRLYAGSDQRSHFEEKELSFGGGQKIESTTLQNANSVVLRRAPAGHVIDWHAAPRRQYVVTVSGSREIECSDCSKRVFKPGDVMLAEDLTGKGHVSRVIGNEPHIFMTVPLAG